MLARLPTLLLLFWLAASAVGSGQPASAPSAGVRRAALDSVAHNPRRMFQTVAARLVTGVDTTVAWRQLDTLLDAPTGDMFWTYPATCFWVLCRNRLNASYRQRFRRLLRSYTPYRGDTENHFLMHYTYLLIFSEEWPELREEEWFNGRSSAENHAEAREYLLHWIDETARYGLTEWDSPRYLYFYVGPLLALAEGARDTAVSRRASMLLELLLADYAVEYLNGAYCGAHSRDGDGSVIDPRRSEATSMGRFYFENRVDPPLPDLAFCALARFTCPGIIRSMATDRPKPSLVTEVRRTRARMRGHDRRFGRVIKQTWIGQDVALGSLMLDSVAKGARTYGDIVQPIQQHTWGITFAAERPNATIFAVHPDASEEELATYFPEEPELMESGILGSKASYGNENRWIGGSRYERVEQAERTLVASYAIPPEARWHHVDLFIPKSLDTLLRDSTGWLFCRMEGGFAAIYLFDTATVWSDEGTNWRVRLRSAETGLMVICGTAAEGPFEAFCRGIHRAVADAQQHGVDLKPDSSARNSWSARLLLGSASRIARSPGDDPGVWAQSPFMEMTSTSVGEHSGARDLAQVILRHRNYQRTLDFIKATVIEEAIPPSGR